MEVIDRDEAAPLDLADIGGQTGAATHAGNIARAGQRPKRLTVGSGCNPKRPFRERSKEALSEPELHARGIRTIAGRLSRD
jgi:hypothetical protein